jgi:hypothetical protein
MLATRERDVSDLKSGGAIFARRTRFAVLPWAALFESDMVLAFLPLIVADILHSLRQKINTEQG